MSRVTAALLIILTLLVSAACDKVPLTAPTQSTITLTISTTSLPINGTAEVIATVVEQAGTPVQNGTLVTFTLSATPSTPPTTPPPTNQTASGPFAFLLPGGARTFTTANGTFADQPGAIGSFDPPEVQTHNGRAVTTFRAGTVSGTVNIGAVSGGAVASSIAVNIGGAAAGQVVVRAEPNTIPVTGGEVQVIAIVTDAAGNVLPGAPVVFSADNGSLSSNSAITDATGEARVTLTTNRETIVTARVGARTGQITVRAVTLPSVTIALANAGVVPEVGVPTSFTITPSSATTGNALRSVVIDFGDGTQENIGAPTAATTTSHVYTSPGQYRVTATATDVQGLTATTSIVIQVNERSAINVTFTALPNPASLTLTQGLVEFTATAIAPTGSSIQSYEWDFGDGASAFTTGGQTNHRYTAPGTYIVRVTVRATNGQEGFSERSVRINP